MSLHNGKNAASGSRCTTADNGDAKTLRWIVWR
jgi:hypothetical protein